MKQPLRILIVEDSKDDAFLLVRELRRAGYEPIHERVDTPEAMSKALGQGNWDIVVSDHTMPRFDSFKALAMLKERGLDIPFIIVSGAIDEEAAVAAMKAGAHDYVRKGNSARLMPAIDRELREAQVRRKHKQAEESLRHSEKRYRNFLEAAPDPVVVYDMQGKVNYLNAAFTLVFGWTLDEVRDKKIDFILDEELPKTLKAIEKIKGGEGFTGFETRRYTKQGKILDINISTAILMDKNGAPEGSVVTLRDVSRQKQAEEEIRKLNKELEQRVIERTAQLEAANRELREATIHLLQSEKMASIGQLSAGVAHEINNPTAFVSSNLKTMADYIVNLSNLTKEYRKLVSELKEAMSAHEGLTAISAQIERISSLEAEADIDFILNDIAELIKESREGAERIKKIVLDLKDFAHPGEDRPKRADINQNLDSTVNIVWNELKYKAKVFKDYGDLPEVECYPQMLNQVFMNLLVNAAQAIKERGEIRIQTRADNGYVAITISDTGVGIPKENLLNIFDPFFTTKEVGRGTGLGLNVAYNIVSKHNGTIAVESTVGKGTTFTIRIPIEN